MPEVAKGTAHQVRNNSKYSHFSCQVKSQFQAPDSEQKYSLHGWSRCPAEQKYSLHGWSRCLADSSKGSIILFTKSFSKINFERCIVHRLKACGGFQKKLR